MAALGVEGGITSMIAMCVLIGASSAVCRLASSSRTRNWALRMTSRTVAGESLSTST